MSAATAATIANPVLELTASGPLDRPQRYERIAERLGHQIRAGAFAPGERLPSERDLARRLEVGRSSVREALAALQLQGVIETRPGAGSYVADDAAERLRSADPHPVYDTSPSSMLEARTAFEPSIARLAAQLGQPDATVERLLDVMDAEPDLQAWNGADRLFHRQLAVMTGNPILIAVADQVSLLMDQPLWQRLRDDSVAQEGRLALHAAEHRMIYEAIVAGDADAAAFFVTQHLERVRRYMTLDDPRT